MEFVLLLASSADEPVPLRTMLIAAALILSPLFAGWALAKNRSKKPPK